MWTALLVEVMRRISSLLAGSPGTMAVFEPASWSKRTLLLRWPLSGPWHWKHLSERIGLMSRLNSTGAAAAVQTDAQSPSATHFALMTRILYPIEFPNAYRRRFPSPERERVGHRPTWPAPLRSRLGLEASQRRFA